MIPELNIHTDGACSGNPGPGGFGVIAVTDGELTGNYGYGYRKTTNNRMELLGMISAHQYIEFNSLEDSDITIYSDSKYVLDSITKGWLDNWLKDPNFKGKKNEDLWRYFDTFRNKLKDSNIKYVWEKGHAGNHFNELADERAVYNRDNPTLTDHAYEQSLQSI